MGSSLAPIVFILARLLCDICITLSPPSEYEYHTPPRYTGNALAFSSAQFPYSPGYIWKGGNLDLLCIDHRQQLYSLSFFNKNTTTKFL